MVASPEYDAYDLHVLKDNIDDITQANVVDSLRTIAHIVAHIGLKTRAETHIRGNRSNNTRHTLRSYLQSWHNWVNAPRKLCIMHVCKQLRTA